MRGAGGVQRAVAPEDLTPPAPLSEAERGEQDKRVTASTSDPSPRPPPRSGEGEKSLASRDEINRISMKRSEGDAEPSIETPAYCVQFDAITRARRRPRFASGSACFYRTFSRAQTQNWRVGLALPC